jgi:hypothetical protein
MGPREVFLSHAHQDRTFASRLSETLRRHGVPVWYSRDRIQGAQQWHDEIGRALNRCDWFAVLLTPSAVHSDWVKRELLFALQKKRYQKRIVPLLRRTCHYDRLSWTLDSMQRIDFTAEFDAGCRALLRVWGIGYEREGTSRRLGPDPDTGDRARSPERRLTRPRNGPRG